MFIMSRFVVILWLGFVVSKVVSIVVLLLSRIECWVCSFI